MLAPEPSLTHEHLFAILRFDVASATGPFNSGECNSVSSTSKIQQQANIRNLQGKWKPIQIRFCIDDGIFDRFTAGSISNPHCP